MLQENDQFLSCEMQAFYKFPNIPEIFNRKKLNGKRRNARSITGIIAVAGTTRTHRNYRRISGIPDWHFYVDFVLAQLLHIEE